MKFNDNLDDERVEFTLKLIMLFLLYALVIVILFAAICLLWIK